MAQNFQGNYNTMLRPSLLQHPEHSPNPPSIMPMSSTPWNIENMPWAQQQTSNMGSNVMQFEAHKNCRTLLCVKRKSDPPITTPPKQFITAEKITAHFNGLHISNNYAQNENANAIHDNTAMNASFNKSYDEYRVTAKELEEKLRKAKKITLCEDLKKFQEEQKKASLLPEALMHRVEKPCTALVLWQPTPLDLLHQRTDTELKEMISKDSKAATNDQDNVELIEDIEFLDTDEFINNNNTCTVDYNNFSHMDEDL